VIETIYYGCRYTHKDISEVYLDVIAVSVEADGYVIKADLKRISDNITVMQDEEIFIELNQLEDMDYYGLC
jgi:hypothetical protein